MHLHDALLRQRPREQKKCVNRGQFAQSLCILYVFLVNALSLRCGVLVNLVLDNAGEPGFPSCKYDSSCNRCCMLMKIFLVFFAL